MSTHLLYMILVERLARFRSGTNISIRRDYKDELVLEWNFIWYHVSKYRYLVWHRDEVVPEWNSWSIRYHVNTALFCNKCQYCITKSKGVKKQLVVCFITNLVPSRTDRSKLSCSFAQGKLVEGDLLVSATSLLSTTVFIRLNTALE